MTQHYNYPLFSFRDPRGWVDVTTPQLVLDSRAELPPSVVVLTYPVEKPDLTLSEHIDEQLATLEQEEAWEGAALEAREDFEVNGSAAELLVVRLPSGPDEPAMKAAQVHLMRNQVLFVFTLTAEEHGFASVQARFVELLGSVRFCA